MKQGLSDDAIAERQDVKVETSAANLRKIRQRARDNGYLPRREAEKRDVP
jgi:DNA-binding CsgD family transcriptional regulator